MAVVRTQWLGFTLESPVVVASSPLSLDADAVARAIDAGAGAIVLPSLFELPVTGAPKLSQTDEAPSGVFVDERGPYLKQLERLRKRFSVPIVGSLNATSPFIWAGIAKDLESAGASAVELNLYEVGAAVERSAQDIEQAQLEAARTVRAAITIPIAVKLSMFYGSVPAFVTQLLAVGVTGVTVFNRFYQPDINLKTMDVDRRLQLSNSSELPIRLHALAALYTPTPESGPPLWLGCTGGVHTGEDAAKAILCGAHVVQIASALLLNGPAYVRVIVDGLKRVFSERSIESVEDARGRLSLSRVPDPERWTRLNYVRQLAAWEPTT